MLNPSHLKNNQYYIKLYKISTKTIVDTFPCSYWDDLCKWCCKYNLHCSLLCPHKWGNIIFKASYISNPINSEGYHANMVVSSGFKTQLSFLYMFGLLHFLLFLLIKFKEIKIIQCFFTVSYLSQVCGVANMKQILSNSSFDLTKNHEICMGLVNNRYNPINCRQHKFVKLTIFD